MILLAGVLAVPLRGSAGSLSMTVIGMFPRLVGKFAYADLKSARQYPWFSQFRDNFCLRVSSNSNKFSRPLA